MSTDKERLLDMADQQLTGFASCRCTGCAMTLVDEMGLTESEWEQLKQEGRSRVNEDDARDIDNYFKYKATQLTD